MVGGARSFTEFTPGNRWVGGARSLLSSPLVIDGLEVLGLLLSSPLGNRWVGGDLSFY